VKRLPVGPVVAACVAWVFCLMAAPDPVLNQSLLRMVAASLVLERRLQSFLGTGLFCGVRALRVGEAEHASINE
jgi:hypothetical protein